MTRPDCITTARLTLRKPQMADVADLHDAMRQPHAMRFWAHPEHETPQRTAEYLARMITNNANGGDDFVIELEGRVIGKAGMWRVPEVGFLLHPDHWGKGYAREVMVAIIEHLFTWHDADHLTAEVDPRNAASLGLLARLGFQETHRATRTMQWRDEWCDSVYLRLPRPGRSHSSR
jgi:RimJ/RimL family protein N-acetyltransferase